MSERASSDVADASPADSEVQSAPITAPRVTTVEPPVSEENLAEAWWLWTIIGTVAIGPAVGIGLGVSLASPPQPSPGDVGGVVLTLSVGGAL
jgi:hypothetical protein